MLNILNLTKIAVEASILAGEKILEIYKSDDFNIQTKSDNSPLTQADKNSHNKIMEFLTDTNLPILSEEGNIANFEERKNWEYYWCIDPLDGTKEFIKKNDEFTVNIALIHKTKPILGIIYVPVLKELYVGSQDYSAIKIENITANNYKEFDLNNIFEAGEKLPKNIKKSKFTVVGSRSHMNKETEDFINDYKLKYGDIDIVSTGSSLKLCMVAEGLADIYPRFAPTMEWDTAAGNAIATAAGFLVTKKDGITDLDYNKENLLNPWFIVKSKDN